MNYFNKIYNKDNKIMELPNKLNESKRNYNNREGLRSIQELPTKYQCLFEFPVFNVVQSKAFDDILYSDEPIVISAPTSSGKTVIFELAIIRLLIQFETYKFTGKYKIIYVAPVKALCTERLSDWHEKFCKIGLTCIVITGDSDKINYNMLENYNIIITTPEKWDCLTRNTKDNEIINEVKLFMIDEVQLLNEESRGPILEAIVSRMKISKNKNIRFLAVSSTIPNIEDIAEWLGTENKPALYYKIGEEYRPVKLNKIVLGYPCDPGIGSFKFDLSLNYKLQAIILKYAEGKPTLIFCSTRKGVEMTAQHITQQLTFHLSQDQEEKLRVASQIMLDNKMKIQLANGVGCHHGGMTPENRGTIENLFKCGHLPVLITTSTLAMGVNLPAHLVIVKSTQQYTQGGFQEYSESSLMQMIGRAGRPQFDTSATVVIMTKNWLKEKYEKMLGGTQLIESNLHQHLTEHINAEVVLGIISDIAVALNWLRQTFLYIRVQKNPKYYNIPVNYTKTQIEKKLQDLCQIEINALNRYGILQIDQIDGFSLTPTNMGKLMANYYLAFNTMKLFYEIKGQESLFDILTLISKCAEFSDTLLRVNDKKTLNTLNRCKYQDTIRFPLPGNIKTTAMKVNCIIQATFGCLRIQDPSLFQESQKIMKIGERVCNCLSEYLLYKDNCFEALYNSLILNQCFHAKIWENSPYVSKQLTKIGAVLSSMLVTAGKTSFKSILEANPRDLERIINRHPPMGNEIQTEVLHLPYYKIKINIPEDDYFKIRILVNLENYEFIEKRCTVGNSYMTLLVGDSENNVLCCKKLYHHSMALCKEFQQNIKIISNLNHKIYAFLISENWVGINCEDKIDINLTNSPSKTIITNKNNEKTKKTEIPKYFKTVKNIPNKKTESNKLKKSLNTPKISGNKTIDSYFPKKIVTPLPTSQTEIQSNKQNKTDSNKVKKEHNFTFKTLTNSQNVDKIKKTNFTSFDKFQDNLKKINENTNHQTQTQNSNNFEKSFNNLENNYSPKSPPQLDDTFPKFVSPKFDFSFDCLQNLSPNNENSQNDVLSFYPKNYSDIFKNVDLTQNSNIDLSQKSVLTDNYQKQNFSQNKITKFNCQDEILTLPSTSSQIPKFVKSQNANPTKTKSTPNLRNPISKKNFLSTYNKNIEKVPEKILDHLSQFKYNPKKKLSHKKLTENEANIFEPEIIIEIDDDECDNEPKTVENKTNENQNNATVNAKPVFYKSFKDYVRENVKKLKEDTIINEHFNFDIGFEEFLMAPLNSSSENSDIQEINLSKDNLSDKSENIQSELQSNSNYNDFDQIYQSNNRKSSETNEINDRSISPLNITLNNNSQNELNQNNLDLTFLNNVPNENNSDIYSLNSQFLEKNDFSFMPQTNTNIQQYNSQNELNQNNLDLTFLNNVPNDNNPEIYSLNPQFLQKNNCSFMQQTETNTENLDDSIGSSESSGSNNIELRVQNKFKIIEQWFDSQSNQKTENVPVKKVKLSSPLKYSKSCKSFEDYSNVSHQNLFKHNNEIPKRKESKQLINYPKNDQKSLNPKETSNIHSSSYQCFVQNEKLSVTIFEKEKTNEENMFLKSTKKKSENKMMFTFEETKKKMFQF